MIIEIPEKITFCEFAGHKHTIKDDSFLIVDMLANYIVEHQRLWYGALQDQGTTNLTMRMNCRWMALSIYQYTSHYDFSDSKHEGRVKKILDWHQMDKTSTYYNQCVDVSSVSEVGVKLAAILVSLYFDDPKSTGWNDLSDYGIGGYMYERAAAVITKGTWYEMTFTCNPASVLTDYNDYSIYDAPRFPYQHSLYEVYLHQAVDLLVDNINWKVLTPDDMRTYYKFGYTDVTDLFIPVIENTLQFKMGDKYGIMEHMFNRLPADGSLTPTSVFRSMQGDYVMLMDSDTITIPDHIHSHVMMHMKASLKISIRKSEADPKELLDVVFPYMLENLGNKEVGLYFYAIASQDRGEQLQLQITPAGGQIRQHNIPMNWHNASWHLIGVDDKLIVLDPNTFRLSMRGATHNLITLGYFGPNSQDIIDKIDSDNKLDLIVTEAGKDPLTEYHTKYEVDHTEAFLYDRVKRNIDPINRTGKYWYEMMNVPAINPTGFALLGGVAQDAERSINIAVGGFYTYEGEKFLEALVHEIGGHFINDPDDATSIWGTHNIEI